MKADYNNIHRPSLLYHLIEELVFLAGTKKLMHNLVTGLKAFSIKTESSFKKLMKHNWAVASVMLTGYMSLSSLLLFLAYKLVMVF